MSTTKKLTIEEVNKRLFERGYYLLSDYKNTKYPIHIVDFEGYKFKSNLSTVMRSKPDKFHQANPYTIENIHLYLKLNNSRFKLLSTKYESNSDNLLFLCERHGEFDSSWNSINMGSGCGYCAGKTVHIDDSVFNKRKDLLVYFENIEDSKTILPKSDKCLNFICPQCKTPKPMKMNTLSSSGFSCTLCSDGISTPEKFMTNILKQLDMYFIRQYSPSWINKRRYDFYIPDKNIIIETHGAQHYIGWSKNETKLLSQLEIDKFKYEMAILHGITEENYIVVDCRKSKFEWLTENCIYSLSNHFKMDCIHWQNVFNYCKTSRLIEVCNDWNNKQEEQTTRFLSEKYNMDKSTIVSYLKKGAAIGLCNYDAKYEINKNNKRKDRDKGRMVIQYNSDMEFISEHKNAIEAGKNLNIDISSIYKCCSNKGRKSVGGYIWKYKSP